MKAFGRFWWDFLIGDDPKIAVSVLVVLVAGAIVVAATSGGWPAAAIAGALLTAFVAAVVLDVRHNR